MIEIFVSMLFALAGFNLFVTWRATRDELATPAQRIAHIGLIWLLPVLGAFVVLRLQRRDPEPHTRRYTELPDAGDDFAGPTGSYRRIRGAPDGGPEDPGD